MFRKLWDRIRNRSPSEHHAVLSKRLRQAKEAEEHAAATIRWLRSRHGETRALLRAERRLERLQKRTNRLAYLVAAARPAVMRAH